MKKENYCGDIFFFLFCLYNDYGIKGRKKEAKA